MLFTIVNEQPSKCVTRTLNIRAEGGMYVVGNPGYYGLAHIGETTARPAHFYPQEAQRFMDRFMEEGFSVNPRDVR